ncbi:hypothetical protein [Anaerosporobacter sp.]|uniref:hypothetical protein n=1 Tax=Anaerosporobacter sp. TaxID=1872529 RepID=UPI002896ECBE|nr:hypothetical protein [Anaerosporobacter sp.]
MKLARRLRELQVRSLATLSYVYLELVAKTCIIRLDGEEIMIGDKIAGYWHGDSYSCQLLIRHMGRKHNKVTVLVTADRRGDYIERMLASYHGNVLRAHDGFGMKEVYREIIEHAKNEEGTFATSLDGPLGPYHEPKKLVFFLAEQAKKEMVFLQFNYSHCISMKNRWDQYKIPLPFTKITIKANDLGMITKKNLKEYKNLI